jgi:hypothetical protein
MLQEGGEVDGWLKFGAGSAEIVLAGWQIG